MMELRPYHQSLQGLPNVRLLYKEPRLKAAARQIIRQRRQRANDEPVADVGEDDDAAATLSDPGDEMDCKPPDHDILNASIQSQDALQAAAAGSCHGGDSSDDQRQVVSVQMQQLAQSIQVLK